MNAYLGESYPYASNIKTPSELGMSGDGNLGALANDIGGLVSYIEVLVSGKSRASRTGGPMGNKFFLKTNGTCKADDGNEVDRYIYVNNVPDGDIPFISSAMNTNFNEFRGLAPGILSDVGQINPKGLVDAIKDGGLPECQPITLEVINNDNVSSQETHYLTRNDIRNMNACHFTDGVNPLTNEKCRMAFTNMSDSGSFGFNRLYMLILGLGAVYLIHKTITKTKR